MKTILYIHGMGGGGDSRIPGLLNTLFNPDEVKTIVRTYDFDPDTGRAQIAEWVKELSPDLVIGESLGAIQALLVKDVPHLFVSPSLGAPENLYKASKIARFALGRWYLHHKFPVKAGDRQKLKFVPEVLVKYRRIGQEAFASIDAKGYYYAFFGKWDHYKKSGVVRLDLWKQFFGESSFTEYDGSHFMENEYVESLLVPKIREVFALQK